MNINSKTTKHPIINWNIEKPPKWEPFQHGNFKKPDVLPPNEVNFMGGLGEVKGNRRKLPQRPTKVQQIFNMRTRNNPVFSFVEDPKLANSCFVPNIKKIENPILIAEKTGLADNFDTPSNSSISQDLTEIFDFNNPLGFDYQGFDHKETYQRDEQDEQNRKEYFIQKRNLDKRVLKSEIEKNVEDTERNEKYKLPLYFDLDYKMEDPLIKQESIVFYKAPLAKEDPQIERRYPDAIPFVQPDKVLSRLVRRTGKKRNIKNVNNEIQRRKIKWTKNIFNKWNKIAEKERKMKEENKIKDKNFVMEIGEKYFDEYFTDDLKEILEMYENLPEIYHEKKFPHNLKETKYLRSSMNQERKLISQRLKIKSEFYKKEIRQPTILKIPEENSISEQSTDDEDELIVGPRSESKFQLRGFHYKMDREPRGMICKKLGKHERTCQTRNVWFQSLAPDSNPPIFFKNNPSSIPSKAVPTDDDYAIFEIESRKPKPIEISPIKEMIENPPPPPKILDPKKHRIKKPPYIRVKKFNLTAYLYGHVRIKKEKPSKYGSGDNKYGVPYEMIERAETLFEQKLAENKRKRHQRLRAMEIPFQEDQLKEEDEEETLNSDSDNWIPSPDQLSEDDQNDKPIYSPSYIKAPDYRQPTIRKHPRRLRDPASIQDIVSSITEKNIDSRFPFNIPRLNRLEENVLIPSNLTYPKKDFVDLFEVRHHHDHKDCTQHKKVQVNFIPKPPGVDQKVKREIETKPKIDPFKRPERKKVDRSLPIFKISDEINQEKSKKLPKDCGEKFPIPLNVSGKSRQHLPIDHPRKHAYEKLIKEKTLELKKMLIGFGAGIEDHEFREKYLRELEEDLESIDSCNSSVTSSVCTNFTNDSGSYILLQGKKVPCDFVTKSEVPFVEVDRTRIVAGDLPKHDEYYGPYYTVPFSGQAIDMRKMTVPKDKFYTNAVRSRFGIRNRLKIDRPSFHEEFIGTREAKYISTLATEWDDYYQHEIKNRPRIQKFRPKTFLTQHREAMRKQFSSIYIQEKNTEMKIRQQTEDEYIWDIENYKNIFTPIFKQWEELFYRRMMRKMQELKPYFEKTDKLKKTVSDLIKSDDRLKMEIIYKEDDWIRRIILQNFHYLIMDVKWREINDWIHMKDDGNLENFRESIENRTTANIRKKDQDDAYAIKTFYEKNYVENFHEIKIVFPDTESFRKGIIHLKIKSFLCLLELHYAMWIYANLSNSYHIFKSSSKSFLDKRSKYVWNRSKKRYFMQDRASNLVKDGDQQLAEPLTESIGCKEFRTLEVLCDKLFEKVIPENIQNSMEENVGVIEKFGMISDLTLDIFGTIDRLPEQILQKIEYEIRRKRTFELRQAERTFANEIRINHLMGQLKKNMSKSTVPRPRRTGKLPRSNLPKKAPKPKETKIKMPEKHRIFYNAFTDISTENIEFENEETAEIINSIEDTCIPFHFDHFLKLHDYYPIYDFKTQIEEREGAEEKRFSYKDVLKDVSKNLKKWMELREKSIAEHISKTWYLYIDAGEKQ